MIADSLMLPRSCPAYAKRVNSLRLKVNRSGGGAKNVRHKLEEMEKFRGKRVACPGQ
jgi:hypothetical protein